MANLLVVTSYPDRNFVSIDSMFTYRMVDATRKYFDKVYVVSPVAWFPRMLGWMGRFSYRIANRVAKRDYKAENVEVFFARYATLGGPFMGDQVERHLLPRVRGVVKRERLRFDLVHTHMLRSAIIGHRLADEYGVPHVVTVHTNRESIVRLLHEDTPQITKALGASEKIVRVSPLDFDLVSSAAGGDDRIVHIPNGFDPAVIPDVPPEVLRRQLGLPLKRKIMLTVCHIMPGKDPMILIESLKSLRGKGHEPLPMLIFIGEDLMRGMVQERVREYGLGDDVKFLGVQPPEKVMSYMRASDIFVLFSRAEGNPTVMFEALGCGRPYIGSDVGGVPTVISDSGLGLIGPPNDLDTAVRLIEEGLAREWDEEYIMDFAKQYTWSNIARRTWEEVYEPLLERT